MRRVLTYAGLAVFICCPGVVQSGPQWKIHGVDSGVTVFTSEVKGSEIPRVRAIAEVHATTDDVWRYITGPSFTINGLKEKRQIGKCGSDCELTYIRVGHPLMTDRHYVARFENRIEPFNGSVRYKRMWRPQNDRTPQDDSAIVVGQVVGSWTLEPLNDGNATRVIYESHVDLGGAVPAALFRKGFVSAAYSVLKKVVDKGPQL